MSSENSETEWTFTATWPASSTDAQLQRLRRLKGALESSLNLVVDMVQGDQPSSARRGPALMVRLSISQTMRGRRRVISIEEHMEPSLPSGSEPAKFYGPSTRGTLWNGDLQEPET